VTTVPVPRRDPADPRSGGRFHPFDSPDGCRVPTFNAASSLKAAIAESPLLHDLPLEPRAQPRRGPDWTSRRYHPAGCILLFGDRIADSAEEIVVETPALPDLHESGTTGFASLQAVMLEGGIAPSP
jgi:hypothetical protein